jgi:hypothetical protein
MKALFLILLLVFVSTQTFKAQVDHEAWLSGGAKYSVTKKLDVSGELNFRIEPVVLNTFFTEFTAKYSVTKWFKPSIDYRIVSDRNKFGNYHWSQRINLNANFETTYKRFELGLRARLQSTLSRVRTPESSFSDLAPGFRLKPEILYDIDNSWISPVVSAEFFYNQEDGLGFYMNRVRLAAGLDFEMIGPYNISLKYLYGFSTLSPKFEHIIAFSFTRKYKSEASKKKDTKKK